MCNPGEGCCGQGLGSAASVTLQVCNFCLFYRTLSIKRGYLCVIQNGRASWEGIGEKETNGFQWLRAKMRTRLSSTLQKDRKFQQGKQTSPSFRSHPMILWMFRGKFPCNCFKTKFPTVPVNQFFLQDTSSVAGATSHPASFASVGWTLKVCYSDW